MSLRRTSKLHDAVLGRSSGRAWARTVEQLRSHAQDREIYDRATLAMRVLERREIAQSELDLVERWLTDDGVLAPQRTPTRARAWMWIGLAFGMAAAAVLALRPSPPSPYEDRFDPKGGGYARLLGLQLLCDDSHGSAQRLRDVAGTSCAKDGTLGFAIRIDDSYTGGAALALFGVADDGEVLYYVPVPDDARQPALAHGRWQPLTRAVKLAVNHRAGRVRVFALLAPTTPSLDAIDEAAAALARQPIATDGDPPWHERLAGTVSLLAACGAPGQCASAELEFWVGPDAGAPDGEPP
ncbi:MAG TPA: hypothetical protein VG755_28825 [Nannocystaceae bacterium]|nr:hypothetical protein [Nannocystaceae bacterium]